MKALKKNHAQTFGGYYVAIIGPDTMYDLQEDDAFVKVSQYQDKENIYTAKSAACSACGWWRRPKRRYLKARARAARTWRA